MNQQKELQKKRQKCHVYTRCMGYLRPVEFYNHGKKSEFYSRKYFDQEKSMKRNFKNPINEINEVNCLSING